MGNPVDATHGRVKPLRIRNLKPAELEEHPIGDARFETSAIGHAQLAGEGNTGGALLGILRPERRQLTSKQIGQSPRSAREELPGVRVQLERSRLVDRQAPVTKDRATSSSAPCTYQERATTCPAQSPTA